MGRSTCRQCDCRPTCLVKLGQLHTDCWAHFQFWIRLFTIGTKLILGIYIKPRRKKNALTMESVAKISSMHLAFITSTYPQISKICNGPIRECDLPLLVLINYYSPQEVLNHDSISVCPPITYIHTYITKIKYYFFPFITNSTTSTLYWMECFVQRKCTCIFNVGTYVTSISQPCH